jgi:hypothetical protein
MQQFVSNVERFLKRATMIIYSKKVMNSGLGLKRKPIFSFSRKAKISENSLTFAKFCFAKIFVFAKDFARNFCSRDGFREKFLFLQKNFNQCFGSGYTFRRLLNPDPHFKRKIFANIFTKRKILRENFRKNENTKTKIFVSTLLRS